MQPSVLSNTEIESFLNKFDPKDRNSILENLLIHSIRSYNNIQSKNLTNSDNKNNNDINSNTSKSLLTPSNKSPKYKSKSVYLPTKQKGRSLSTIKKTSKRNKSQSFKNNCINEIQSQIIKERQGSQQGNKSNKPVDNSPQICFFKNKAECVNECIKIITEKGRYLASKPLSFTPEDIYRKTFRSSSVPRSIIKFY